MSEERVLVVDVGNTTVALGWFEGGGLRSAVRVPVGEAGGLDENWPGDLPPPGRLGSAAVVACSVNPRVEREVEDALSRLGLSLLLLRRDIPVDIPVRVPHPEQVGADRLINARQAYRLCSGPAMVVDFGTAVTVDCVSADGAYIGGTIAPGVRLGAAALNEHTALLPAVNLVPDPPVLATDTVAAIQSGLFWGTVGAVRELLRRLMAEMPTGTAVLATGGDASLFAPHLPELQRVVPHLTLEGLYRIYCDVHQRG